MIFFPVIYAHIESEREGENRKEIDNIKWKSKSRISHAIVFDPCTLTKEEHSHC